MLEMFFPNHIVDIHIINKNFQKFVHVSSKDLCHGPRECANSIIYVKKHDNPIK